MRSKSDLERIETPRNHFQLPNSSDQATFKSFKARVVIFISEMVKNFFLL